MKYPVSKIPWAYIRPPAFTAFGRIYLRKSLWIDYCSGNPSPETLAMIAHEEAHIKRGLRIFIRYWLNSEFRFQEELAAIKEEMRVLKQHGEQFDIKKRAKELSGMAYLWCSSNEEAKKA